MQPIRSLLTALALVLVLASGVAAQSRVLFVPIPPEFNAQVEDGKPLPAGMDAAPLFGGEQIASASLGTDQLDHPAIDLVLTPEGARLMDNWAAAHFQERFAIVLDGTVVSAPSINATSFNGQIQISGNFTPAEANALLEAINGGGTAPVIATGEEAAALVIASDSKFADVKNYADLHREVLATFRYVTLINSFYRVVPTSIIDFGSIFGGSPTAVDPRGSWEVEVMLVAGCGPIDDLNTLVADPCQWRHAWHFRVQTDGTMTLLFEEGGPIPIGK
jgi:hypothetical protein